jgi:hypothetical protein
MVPTDRVEATPRSHDRCLVVVTRCKRLAIVVEEGAAARREREADAVLRSAETEPNADMAGCSDAGREGVREERRGELVNSVIG